ARTTATDAGFISGPYLVFTPLMVAAAFRRRTPGSAWWAIAIGFVGLALLSITSLNALRLRAGDLLVLGGAVAWAGHITAVGHFSPRFPSWMLSLGQMGVAAALHLAVAAPSGLRFGTAAAFSVWPLLGLTG